MVGCQTWKYGEIGVSSSPRCSFIIAQISSMGTIHHFDTLIRFKYSLEFEAGIIIRPTLPDFCRIGLREINMKWIWTDINMTEDSIWMPPGSSASGTPDLHCVAMRRNGAWHVSNCNTSLPYICKSEIGNFSVSKMFNMQEYFVFKLSIDFLVINWKLYPILIV